MNITRIFYFLHKIIKKKNNYITWKVNLPKIISIRIQNIDNLNEITVYSD